MSSLFDLDVVSKADRRRWWYLFFAIGGSLSFVGIYMYYGIKFYTWLGSEKIIRYTIDAPNPPGDGRVLENPSIKVRNAGVEGTASRSQTDIGRLLARQLYNVMLLRLASSWDS